MTARSQRSGWFEPLCGPAADSLTVASSNIRLLPTSPTITRHLWDSRDTVTRPPGHLAATLPVRLPAAMPGAAIEPTGNSSTGCDDPTTISYVPAASPPVRPAPPGRLRPPHPRCWTSRVRREPNPAPGRPRWRAARGSPAVVPAPG